MLAYCRLQAQHLLMLHLIALPVVVCRRVHYASWAQQQHCAEERNQILHGWTSESKPQLMKHAGHNWMPLSSAVCLRRLLAWLQDEGAHAHAYSEHVCSCRST